MSTQGTRRNDETNRRPFRAVDVLSGNIDRRGSAKPERVRKQISAQLEPAQIQLLGELHARLNAGASKRIEKSDLVGLGIELLAAALEGAGQNLASASEQNGISTRAGNSPTGSNAGSAFDDVDDIRAYVRTYVRGIDQ